VVTDIPSALLWVYVDGLLFEKLLTNLLENAAKFSNVGSVVTLAAAARDEAIEIRVSDEGCGLPPGDTDTIFRKFHRGTSGNAVPGIGLGLSICRAVVELHGGLITALHRPTAGSEFVVRLPVGPGAPAAQMESEIASAPCEETA
jgi:two-component system sensor histidine kinase KdpD